MATIIHLGADAIFSLDMADFQGAIASVQAEPGWARSDLQIRFEIDYPQAQGDPRELSEIAEVRLWFIRCDVCYPWLPLYLDWKAGELGRYVAMLVPHQFHPTEGIQYNPEALEIWVMGRIFILYGWLRQQGIEGTARLKSMTQMLGYELDDAFFQLLAEK